MFGHLRLHILAVVVASLGLGACAASRPGVKVIGVQESNQAPRTSLVVFVEVTNPTSRNLQLSRLEYQVHADSWFESRGQVRVTREIAAGESAVVEIPVPVEHASQIAEGKVPYSLEGRLFAVEDHVEHSWKVALHGVLGVAGGADGPVRVTAVYEAR